MYKCSFKPQRTPKLTWVREINSFKMKCLRRLNCDNSLYFSCTVINFSWSELCQWRASVARLRMTWWRPSWWYLICEDHLSNCRYDKSPPTPTYPLFYLRLLNLKGLIKTYILVCFNIQICIWMMLTYFGFWKLMKLRISGRLLIRYTGFTRCFLKLRETDARVFWEKLTTPSSQWMRARSHPLSLRTTAAPEGLLKYFV